MLHLNSVPQLLATEHQFKITMKVKSLEKLNFNVKSGRSECEILIPNVWRQNLYVQRQNEEADAPNQH